MLVNKRYNIVEIVKGDDIAYLETQDEVEKLIKDKYPESVKYFVMDLNNIEPGVPAMVWLNMMGRLEKKEGKDLERSKSSDQT